jgi:hypothetical protein
MPHRLLWTSIKTRAGIPKSAWRPPGLRPTTPVTDVKAFDFKNGWSSRGSSHLDFCDFVELDKEMLSKNVGNNRVLLWVSTTPTKIILITRLYRF